uniref:C-type lectin domain-containing protein n=1 Tax=Naja naja TaxID=35670 RepID=A0A8C6VQZ2_NAJNA
MFLFSDFSARITKSEVDGSNVRQIEQINGKSHQKKRYMEHCYKFSGEKKNWKESQNVCISHTASLAKITQEEKVSHVFWIGLKREPGQPWKWLDGENATKIFPLTVQIDLRKSLLASSIQDLPL